MIIRKLRKLELKVMFIEWFYKYIMIVILLYKLDKFNYKQSYFKIN